MYMWGYTRPLLSGLLEEARGPLSGRVGQDQVRLTGEK